MQVVDRVTGWLCRSVPECADRIVEALQDPAAAQALGESARELVRKRFLITRHASDYLRVLASVARPHSTQGEITR